MFDLIAFDADDTLWENEGNYQQTRAAYQEILQAYSLPADLTELLDETENRNIPYFGYGVSSFTFSLIETAIRATGQTITAKDIQAILDLARTMLDARIELYDHAEPTLQRLSRDHRLMLITKGDLLHQQVKIARSGLGEYFANIEVVADKTREIYAEILSRYNVAPQNFLMIGNSMRSDILPVLELGARAVYIPGRATWSHEHSDLPPQLAEHFVELAHIGQLPEWIKTIEQRFG